MKIAKHLVSILLFAAASLSAEAQSLERVSPEEVGIDSRHLLFADAAIERAIAGGEIPGAVLAVVRDGKMAYIKAFGNRRVEPQCEPMSERTIFDLASCTKPLATATAVMILAERGQLRLLDPVSDYLPSFLNWRGPDGKRKKIRIMDLLTHTSGLPSYVTPQKLEKEYGEATLKTLMNYICTCSREFEPQTDFTYSCLNYITLQQIIESITGESLRDFAHTNIFAPLGMTRTDYHPCTDGASDPRDLEDVAPTEKLPDGHILWGEVQDPLARTVLGGISGNAGLFAPADDIALFCAMILNGGEWNGARILSPLAVRTMTTVPRATSDIGRTPGWDIFTAYASVNGDFFGRETFGHTGHTGTSIVIDPQTRTAVILLTNAVHPDDRTSVVRLRSLVSNAVASAIGR